MSIVLTCIALAGCGGDDEEKGEPIPRAQAAELERRLGEVERRLDDGSVGACEDILDDTEPAVRNILASIPNDVDADVRQALADSFGRLWQLTSDTCDERRAESETETEETETVEPPPVTTEETTPRETETEEPPESQQPPEGEPPGQQKKKDKPPDEEGGGNGRGGGVIAPDEEDGG